MHSSFVAETEGFYILQFGESWSFQVVVDSWEKSCDIAIFLWNYVKTLYRAVAFHEHKYAIIMLIVECISCCHHFSWVLWYNCEWRDVISRYQVKSFDSVLFDLKRTDKSVLGKFLESFIDLFIFFMKPQYIAFSFIDGWIQLHQVIFFLVLINLIIDESQFFSRKSIVETGLIVNNKLPRGHMIGYFEIEVSLSFESLNLFSMF